MQTSRIVQAVILMIVVAFAASCAASKEYSAKIFAPRNPMETQKTVRVANLRFLELDKLGGDSSQWVQTDIINGRDTSNQTLALDNLSKTVPAAGAKEKPSTAISVDEKPATVKSEKTGPEESEPVAKTVTQPNGTRTKTTREKPE